MTTNRTEFAGLDQEFALGSIKGLRSWGMDEDGRLHGVTHREVWTPGENIAKCQKPSDRECPRWFEYCCENLRWREMQSGGKKGRKLVPPPAKPKPCGSNCDGKVHRDVRHAFDPNCQCGFWAYDEDNFTSHGDVVGMIEGFGLTTIGTKGFRCQKARILALVTDGLSRGRVRRLSQLYPEVEFYDTRAAMLEVHEAVFDNPSGPETDEDFWTRPVKPRDDYYRSLFGGISPSWSLQPARISSPSQIFKYGSGVVA